MATRAAAEKRSFARRAAVLVALVSSLAVTTGACLPEGRPCSPGDYVPCNCSGGGSGGAMCNEDGTAYGACDCTILTDGAIPPATDAGEDAAEGGACGGTTNLGLTCPCTDNSSCASDFCYTYPSKGPHCTDHCKVDADCPPPALGCNPQGICKVP